jgi:hypothetical protein
MQYRTTTTERDTILAALYSFVSQRPGLDYGNYGNLSCYRSDYRQINRALHDARFLLGQIQWRTSISADDLKRALDGAFAGRLSWDGTRLEYCIGQYWPTEYRNAVCAVLASALWDYFRRDIPATDPSPGATIRAKIRREFGLAIQRRWFD